MAAGCISKLRTNSDDYLQLSGSDSKVSAYRDTAISGNLEISKALAFKRVPGISGTTHLTIINESLSGASIAPYTSTASNQGCVFLHTAAASPTPWMTGVIWGGLNEFVIRYGYNTFGLTLEPTGDAAITGNLDVGVGASSVKAYVDHLGHQGNVEIKARWNSQGFIHFNTTNPDGLLLIAAKGDLYLYCGLNITCFTNQQQMHQMIGLKKRRNYRTCL